MAEASIPYTVQDANGKVSLIRGFANLPLQYKALSWYYSRHDSAAFIGRHSLQQLARSRGKWVY